ncbi:MAG TPA: hypothetical protein VND45_01495 [Thermoanaerobaculia bacterium]|nr:hypothetical protein [Thermoanaerobaculia bacterium]
MILYYAVGGGLGHLVRATCVLEKLALDATIVTASPFAERVCGARPFLRVPRELERDRVAHRDWIRGLGAERILADAFPGGIHGELCGLDVPVDYVARLLRWDAYRAAVPYALPQIATTYVVEELTHAPPGNATALDLSLPRVPVVNEEAYWLVVHSGPEEEVRELVAYARELGAPRDLRVISGGEVWPATPLFPAAAKIITAAGFNVVLETEQWRGKHVAVPFPRRFDDQFARARRLKKKRLSSANAPGPAAARYSHSQQ